MNPANDFTSHDEQILDLLDGSLSGDKQAELRDWLDASPEHWERFAHLSFIHSQIADQLHRHQSSTDIRLDALQMTSAEHAQELPPIHIDADVLTKEKYLSALTYVLEHAFTRKRVVLLATAAVVLLGTVLAIVLMTGPQPTPEIVQTPDEPAIQTPSVVATLTATHNAQWAQHSAEGASAPGSLQLGSKLHPNQRLTLIAGFAEITTHDGAIAIVEAPATIELLDHKNAIRLHAGKLVGICETESAKGFVVRTTNAIVIDLGTEFGVEVQRTGETNVFVFDGLVALAAPDEDLRTAELTKVAAGQAKQVDRVGRIVAIDPSSTKQTFVRSVDPDVRYEQMVLADKPLVYYRMDPFTGGVARNIAADRYHAKVFGGSNTVTDGMRSSISLGSFGDYLQTIEPIVELRAADSYTIECWARPTRRNFGSICMIGKPNENSDVGVDTAARLELTEPLGQIGAKDRIRFLHMNEVGSNNQALTKEDFNEIFSKEPHPLNRWMHIAAVKDGERLSLYIDGQKVAEGQANQPLLDQEQQITIGRFSTAATEQSAHTRQFLGELDELAVYDHALSADAIRARYEAGQFWLAND